MSTSHGAGTAKVRPVNDDFEAETAESRPVTTAEATPAAAAVAEPAKKTYDNPKGVSCTAGPGAKD